MKKNKTFTLLLTTTLVAGLISGCKKIEAIKTVTTTDDKSPITFTFYNTDGVDDDFSNPIAREITKRTGVTLKIDHPVSGDNNRIALMIASKEYPDIIFAKGDTAKLVSAGALIKLDDYISKDGKNVQNLFGDYLKRMRFSKEDPSIYYLGAYAIDSAILSTSGTFQIQNAVLKDQGYPDVRKWTLQDLENAIKAYKDKYPKIDGNDTIGLSLYTDDWGWLITVGNPAGAVLGYLGDGQWAVDQTTYKATYKFLVPEMRDYYKWLNHMNSIGLLDKESFTQKFDQYRAKLSTGRVLATADGEWNYIDAMKSLVSQNKPERTLFPIPVVAKEGIKCPILAYGGYIGGAGVAITTSCKDTERAFKFLDWMCSDEAQVLNNWGIEGVNYKVENGKRVILDDEQKRKNTDKDYAKKTGIQSYFYPFPMRGDGQVDLTGNPFTTNTRENVIKNYNSAKKETLKAYGVAMDTDLFPQTKEFKIPPYGAGWAITIPQESDLTLLNKKIDECSQKELPAVILCDPNKFDEVWNRYQEDLKSLGADKASELMTQLLKEKIDMWK